MSTYAAFAEPTYLSHAEHNRLAAEARAHIAERSAARERQSAAKDAARSFVPRFAKGAAIVVEQARVRLVSTSFDRHYRLRGDMVTVDGPISATVIGVADFAPGYLVEIDGYTPPAGYLLDGPAYVAPSRARPATTGGKD